jgi:hypothetical protein
MTASEILDRSPLVVYLLPILHLGVCLAIWFGHINTGWQYLLMIDFPFSVVLAGLMFAGVNQLLSFGILGTLWWYVLSLAARRFLRTANTRKGG